MMNKIRNYIKLHHMIEKGDRIVIGVSGGADSVALLLVLLELKQEYELELFAVHMNHGIRKEASEDAEYVEKLCDSLSVPFYLFEENVPKLAKERKMTEEEMGRVRRYQCFFEVMEQVGAGKLAVAHHMDDQAETMLFHLVRGTGIAGMTGMRPVMEAWYEKESKIIRPLLKCRKEELTKWLTGKNVAWKEDRTNQDDTYSRNRIRNQVLPELEQVNAQAVAHMAEYAEDMAEYQEFFQKMVRTYVQENVRVVSGCGETDRNRLTQQEKILARAVIYEMLCLVSGKKKDISKVHVQAVYDLLQKQSGRKISLPYEMEAVISYEILQIRKELQTTGVNEEYEMRFQPFEMKDASKKEKVLDLPQGDRMILHLYEKEKCGEGDWKKMVEMAQNSKNNYTKFFECDTIMGTLCIRNAGKEDYFVMNTQGSKKKLSRYFIDRKVPAQQRGKTLVVASGHEVLWIVGERRCEAYKVTGDSQLILEMTYKGESYGTSN